MEEPKSAQKKHVYRYIKSTNEISKKHDSLFSSLFFIRTTILNALIFRWRFYAQAALIKAQNTPPFHRRLIRTQSTTRDCE